MDKEREEKMIKLPCSAINRKQFTGGPRHLKKIAPCGAQSPKTAAVELVHANKLNCRPFAEQFLLPTLYTVISVLLCAVKRMVLKDSR